VKALILGASGQVGRALVHSAPGDWQLIALDRQGCDLADHSTLSLTIRRNRPDLLINAAAYTAVDRAEHEPALVNRINGEAVARMREALADCGGRLVRISTDYVFDGRTTRPYRPTDLAAPLSVYGHSKALGEAAAGSTALIIRTSWVYAAYGSNFVQTMLRLVSERESLHIVADQIAAPTAAPGLARTIWALAISNASGIYHHRDAGLASWYDFAMAIQEEALACGLLDKAIRIIPIATADYPTPARRPAFSLLDDSATRALLGDGYTHWRSRLREILRDSARSTRHP
jgi:dTDP-4-dehydrorhamnose reductase